jgi:voltage-gated potassium channel
VEGEGAMMPLFFRLFVRRVLHNPPAALRVIALLAAVVTYGASGFLYFELPAKPDLGWGDAVWWTLVTITTIGYGDFFPSSPGGRFLVAVPMMLFGVGLLGYVLSLAASALVEAKTKALRGMSAMSHLSKHLVILNFPSLAKVEHVVDELRHDAALGRSIDVVLVDEDLEENPAELVRRHVHFVRGNPARDETLTRAGIDAASYAVVLTKRPGDAHSDAEGLAITLAIEARHKGVRTVVECVDSETRELLHKAGCDSVVCSSRFDSLFIGNEVLSAGVQEVVEELLDYFEGQQLFFSALDRDAPEPFSKLAARYRGKGNLVLGVRRDHKNHLNPPDDFEVRPGDQVINIGVRRL